MTSDFTEADLLYKGYKETAYADHDDPKIIDGKDHSSLNRTEAYEMTHFINSLALTWGWKHLTKERGQTLEQIIKDEVPHNIETRHAIRDWIAASYDV